MIAYDVGIVEQKRAVLRVVPVGARSCEKWLYIMLDKDRCTRLSETKRYKKYKKLN